MQRTFSSVLPGAANVASGTALALACLGLLGHIIDAPELYAVRPGLAALSVLTALLIALLAVGQLCRTHGEGKGSSAAAAAAFIGGAATVASHLLAGRDLLNPLIAQMLAANPVAIGRTSGATGAAIVLLAGALQPWFRMRPRAMDALAGCALLVCLLALFGYAYGSADLYALPLFRTMSLPTAVAIFLLAAATILQQDNGGWAATLSAKGAAGHVTRRQLLFLFVPALVGWGLVQAADAGLLRLGGAVAVLVVSTVAPLFWLIMHDGRSLIALEEAKQQQATLEANHLAALEDKLLAQAVELEQQGLDQLRLAEAATLTSEERYQLLFNSIDAGFCVLELKFDEAGKAIDYRFVEVNAAFAANTGLVAAEGRWMRDLVPDHEQHWFKLYGDVAATGEPVRFEAAAAALGRWYDVHAFPIKGDQRQVGVLFSDISERRRAEILVQEMNATLEQRIEAALGERERAQAALRQSQKMEAMGLLTGGVAHDFNNLLTPIIGSLDLLAYRGFGSAREQRLIEAAMQSADRAKTLVQRLLTFARRQPLRIGPVDIATLVSGMADLVASTTGPQIAIQIQIENELPAALADTHQLEMAILNLCVNARDAMPDGGTLTIAACETTVTETHAEIGQGRYVQLSISDTGIGMDAETLKRAVEPFYSTKSIGKGTGLGLSMVHGLAAQLNGALSISSCPDAGTRIDLLLPLSEAPAALANDLNHPVTTLRNRGRVLVVDDDLVVRMTTSDMLTDLGFTTLEAASAHEAETLLLAGEGFDLVVTDHLMPGMTGAEFARLVRDRWPKLPVLLVSGYASTEEVAPDLPRLAKPFRTAELAQAVGSLVAG